MSFNKREHIDHTLTVMDTLINLPNQPLHNNDLEQANRNLFKQFKGFGALSSEILNDSSFMQKIIPMLEILADKLDVKYDYLMRDFRQSVLSSFFTPVDFVDSIVSNIPEEYLNNILEPSAGSGRFIESILKHNPNANITAVEKNIITGRLLDLSFHDNANVQIDIGGFEDKSYQNMDLVISNIPFGDFPVFDRSFATDANKRNYQKSIDSFFFAKGLDTLKDKGFLIFIAPKGIMDSPNNSLLRRYLIDNADLLGATRLHNNTFLEDSNTKVVTDLIVLQKNANKRIISRSEELFAETRPFSFDGVETSLNGFYHANPHLINGKPEIGFFHNRKGITFSPVNENSILPNVIQVLNSSFNSINASHSFSIEKLITSSILDSKGDYSIFKELLEEQGVEPVFQFKNGKMVDLRFIGDDGPSLNINTTIREVLNKSAQLFIAENFHKGLNSINRKASIDKSKGIQISLFDNINETIKSEQETSKRYTEQLSIFDTPVVAKTSDLKATPDPKPIVKEQTNKENNIIPTQSKETLIDHIINLHKQITEGENNNDSTDHLREQLNGSYNAFNDKYGALKDKKNISLIEEKYNNDSYFLLTLNENSDILKPKKQLVFENARDALTKSLIEYGRINNEYISSLLPDKHWREICEELIEDNLVYRDPSGQYGTIILSDEYLSGDVSSKLSQAQRAYQANGLKEYKRNYEDLLAIQPQLIPIQDIDINLGVRWVDTSVYREFIQNKLGVSVNVNYMTGADKYLFAMSSTDKIKLDQIWQVGRFHIDNILESAFSQLYPAITTKIDEKTTVVDQVATRKLQTKIDTIHRMWKEFYTGNEVTAKYLENRYNKIYNSTVERKFSTPLEFSNVKVFKPYIHQNEAVWRNIQQGGGIFDHRVGSGKTLTMSLAAYYLKSMGLAKKPMITALKANYQAIADEFKTAFPNARVLCPGTNDFTSKERKKLIGLMQNNEYDCIILTHEQFGKIPQDYGIQKRLIQDELSGLQEEMDSLKKMNVKISKMAEKGLLKRQLRLEAKLETLAVSMKKDSGIPTFKEIGIDHLFVDESQQFKNLEFNTRHLNVAGLGNSMGSQRAFNLLIACRTLQEYHGQDKGITFASGTTISNSLVELYSLFKYLRPRHLEQQRIQSFDSWASMFAKKSVDYELTITAEVKKKERFREFVNVPELVNLYTEITDVRNDHNLKLEQPESEVHLISVIPTREQQIFNEKLIDFAKAKSETEIRSKLSELINRPTKKGDKDAKMLLATTLAKKMSIDMKLIDKDLYSDYVSPKLQAIANNVNDFYNKSSEDRGTQFIFCDTGTPNTGSYSVYQEVKNLLIEQGIDERSIAFIHDYSTDTKRKKLFDMVNKGEIRVVLGSTQKMGTGVNMQERCVAMHHIDIPWRPSDVEQRNGRGVRQGNWLAKSKFDNKVQVFFYATERTLDAYQFELLKAKQKIIDQVKDNSLGVRKVEEGSGEGAMNYAEYVAALTGNDDLLKLTKLNTTIAELEAQKKTFINQQREYQYTLDSNKSMIKNHENSLAAFEKEAKSLSDNLIRFLPEEAKSLNLDGHGLIGVVDFKYSLCNSELGINKTYEKVDDFGKDLLQQESALRYAKHLTAKDYPLSTFFGFELVLSKTSQYTGFKLVSPNGLSYKPDNYIDTERKAGMFIKNTFKRIMDRPTEMRDTIDDIKKKNSFLIQQKGQMETSFSKEDILNKYKAERDVIQNRLDGVQEKSISQKMA